MSFDCNTCAGVSREEERDCAECGGTGYYPPSRDPDRHCRRCERPLWLGHRGPIWYSLKTDVNARAAICHHCLAAELEARIYGRRPKTNPINLGDALAGKARR